MQNNSKKKYPVKRMDISINMEKTGAHIKRSIKESGYTMREIMEITGITTEQTIYKWYSGKSIPSLETQIVICKLLGLRITELLVLDGEFDLSGELLSPDKSSSQSIVYYHMFCSNAA
jgi:transcriptional regulator with XRE-family HTH domain